MGKGSKGGSAKPHVVAPKQGHTAKTSNAPKSETKTGQIKPGTHGTGKGAK